MACTPGGETILADRPQRFAGIAFSLSLRQQRVADVSFVRIFRTDAEPNIAQRLAEFIAQYKHPGSAQRLTKTLRSTSSLNTSP